MIFPWFPMMSHSFVPFVGRHFFSKTPPWLSCQGQMQKSPYTLPRSCLRRTANFAAWNVPKTAWNVALFFRHFTWTNREDAVEFPGIFEYQHQLCDWISAKKRGLNVSWKDCYFLLTPTQTREHGYNDWYWILGTISPFIFVRMNIQPRSNYLYI